MVLFKNIQKYDDGPIAKTQIIDINGDLLDYIYKLLRSKTSKLSVNYGYRDGERKRNPDEGFESWETYAKRMNGEIKDIIRNRLCLDKTNHITYEVVRESLGRNRKHRWFFFYLSEEVSDPENLIYSLQKEGLLLGKIFQTLMSLQLKCYFIADAQSLYQIESMHFNSELYLNAKTVSNRRNNDMYIHALKPSLYLGEKQDLCLSISRIAFKAEKADGVIAQTDDISLYFKYGSQAYSNYKIINKLDARKYQVPYMSFGPEYFQCVNFTENLIMTILMVILDIYKISYSPRYFQANYISNYFLDLEQQRELPLVIIDNLGESPLDESNGRIENLQQLKDLLKPESIIQVEGGHPEFDLLRKDRAYLVLNRSRKDGTSIRNLSEEQRYADKIKKAESDGEKISLKSKGYTNFWQVLDDCKKNPNDIFDYYTTLKLASFNSGNNAVIQGLDIERLDVFTSKRKQNRKTGGVITENIPPINESKLLKIDTELWLKERIRFHKKIQPIDLPDGQFILYKFRNTKAKTFLACSVTIYIQNHCLEVKNVEFYSDEQRFRAYHECFNEDIYPKLYDDAFYLYDVNSVIVLSHYHTNRVPRIIGNINVDSVDVGLNSDRGPGRAADNTVLPYYISRVLGKQYHHIYMQHNEKDLTYFVSPINKPNMALPKQNLTYNIRVTDVNGQLLDPLTVLVTSVFLQSLTLNIHKVNEVSKSSILEKIVDSYLAN